MAARLAPVLLAVLAACATPTETLYRDAAEELAIAGRLRLDPAPPDAPFTDEDLARNFVTIALSLEKFGAQERSARPIARWEGPIVYALLSDRPEDARDVATYMARLSALTGLEIRREGLRPEDRLNFVVFIGDRAAREDSARLIEKRKGPLWQSFAEALRVPETLSPYHGKLYPDRRHLIRAAVVIINDETSGRLRRTCIEEELAQSMGLTNDDDEVRPSLFNDDQEFAVLTRHDEVLLRMLYHPLIRPGMTEREVAPLLPRVLRDLRAGGAI